MFLRISWSCVMNIVEVIRMISTIATILTFSGARTARLQEGLRDLRAEDLGVLQRLDVRLA